MPHEPVVVSDYLDIAFKHAKVQKFLRAAKKLLKDVEFDAIAFRGVSGALVAPVLAHHLKKSLLVVRKPKTEETRHSYMPVEGMLPQSDS